MSSNSHLEKELDRLQSFQEQAAIESNQSFRKASDQLILAATVLVALTTPFLGNEKVLSALTLYEAQYWNFLWSLILSIVLGIGQHIADHYFFREWSKRAVDTSKLLIEEFKTKRSLTEEEIMSVVSKGMTGSFSSPQAFFFLQCAALIYGTAFLLVIVNAVLGGYATF